MISKSDLSLDLFKKKPLIRLQLIKKKTINIPYIQEVVSNILALKESNCFLKLVKRNCIA